MSDIIQTCRDSIDKIKSGEAANDQVLAAIDFVAKLGELYRELKSQVEDAAIDHINIMGAIEDGTRRFYVAPNKSTKCTDMRGTVRAVLDATGGDIEAFAECLSSDAFKPATTRKLLGEKGDELFVTKITDDLKSGKPGPARLQQADSKFIR